MIASADVVDVCPETSSTPTTFSIGTWRPNLQLMSSRELSDLPLPTAYTRGPEGVVSSLHDPTAQTAPPPGPHSAGRVVTVGNFDGVHIGHAVIVHRLCEMAAAKNAESVVLTFDPHPATLVRPDKAPTPLSTAVRRAELLLGLGVDRVLVQPMVPAVVALTATEFFDQVLCDRLATVGLVEGVDFHFGRGREGNVDTLATLCQQHGIAFDVVHPVQQDESTISSSRVRSLIAAGEVASANRLLTAAYRVSGTVVEGAKRGRTLGFPTANLGDPQTLLPAAGVYAATAMADGDGTEDDRSGWYPAAVHIGANVSFGETHLSVEAHLIGFEGDLYGRTLHVDFLQRLRETHRFDSPGALISQLKADVQQAADLVSASGRLLLPSRTFPLPPHPHAS
jgi:riboflavin kinase/FMN adenylyltransferase